MCIDASGGIARVFVLSVFALDAAPKGTAGVDRGRKRLDGGGGACVLVERTNRGFFPDDEKGGREQIFGLGPAAGKGGVAVAWWRAHTLPSGWGS